MIDCHIIVSADTPRDWVTQCLDSVHDAADRAGYPVHVHAVPGVPGHIGRARAAGYALGEAPYVTCADDDDYLLPHAFAQLADALDAMIRPDAIFSPEMTLQNGQLRPGHPRHHLAVYRRSVLIDHALWPCCGDVAQRVAAERGAVIDVTTVAYVHRLYPASKARALRRADPTELRRAHG